MTISPRTVIPTRNDRAITETDARLALVVARSLDLHRKEYQLTIEQYRVYIFSSASDRDTVAKERQ